MTDQHFLLRWNDAIMADSAPGDERRALIARCLAGEQRAYELYDYYSGLIYRLSYSLLGDREDAEEVLQDSFEYAFRRPDHFDARKSAFKDLVTGSPSAAAATSAAANGCRRSRSAPSTATNRDPAATPRTSALLSEQQREVWRPSATCRPSCARWQSCAILAVCPMPDRFGTPTSRPRRPRSRMRLAHKARCGERPSDIVE